MDKISYLHSIGYTDKYIKSLILDGKIIVNDNNIVINDFGLLLNIVSKSLSYGEKIADFFNVINNDEKLDLLLFTKYFVYHQHKLEEDILKRIYKIHPINEYKVLIDGLDQVNDNIIYIINENDFNNKVVIDGLKKMERSALIDLDEAYIDKALKTLVDLSKIYYRQSPTPFLVVKSYIEAINNLTLNHTYLGKRKEEDAAGNANAVLNALLKCHDYYRAHQVILENYSENDEFCIEWEIYNILDSIMYKTLKKNEEFVLKQMEINANGLNTKKTILKDYNLSNISGNLVDKINIKYDFNIDKNVNYYSLYNKYKRLKDYDNAKLSIIKFQRSLEEDGMFVDFDYLVKELDILIYNRNGYDNNLRDELIELGNKAMSLCKYENAIKYFKESFKYDLKKNPTTIAMIARCEMKLKNYREALKYFEEAEKDYLYPVDYLNMVNIFYELGEYNKILNYASKYEFYYPDESAELHYILSICYLHFHNYKMALSEISECEIINQEYYNIPINYVKERNIIDKLSKGRIANPYVLKDFYEYSYTNEELKKIRSLEIDSYLDNGELVKKVMDITKNSNSRTEDKIRYLLLIGKTLKDMKRDNDALSLFNLCDDIISNSKLSATDENHFTLMLRNYRNL